MEFSPAPPDHEALDCRLPNRQTMPVVVASPHSGSNYSTEFLAQAAEKAVNCPIYGVGRAIRNASVLTRAVEIRK